MRQSVQTEELVQHNTLKYIVLIFSIVFVSVIANGYYNLFVSKNEFIAGIVGLLLAFLAWFIGKFIGSSSTGIIGNFPIFILLLLLSAFGVFNSLMMNLEGRHIYLEAIEDSSLKFKDINLKAKSNFQDQRVIHPEINRQ